VKSAQYAPEESFHLQDIITSHLIQLYTVYKTLYSSGSGACHVIQQCCKHEPWCWQRRCFSLCSMLKLLMVSCAAPMWRCLKELQLRPSACTRKLEPHLQDLDAHCAAWQGCAAMARSILDVAQTPPCAAPGALHVACRLQVCSAAGCMLGVSSQYMSARCSHR
jgi:hypothetical protein